MPISKTQLLLVVLLPLVGSLLAGLFGRKIGRVGAHSVTILGVAASCVLSCHVLWQLMQGAAPLSRCRPWSSPSRCLEGGAARRPATSDGTRPPAPSLVA